MSLVVPLYCVHQLGIDRGIEIDEFCFQEWPTNEVFDGRSTLFDMFDILDSPNRPPRTSTNFVPKVRSTYQSTTGDSCPDSN